jgi:hypothetical protein
MINDVMSVDSIFEDEENDPYAHDLMYKTMGMTPVYQLLDIVEWFPLYLNNYLTRQYPEMDRRVGKIFIIGIGIGFLPDMNIGKIITAEA